MDTVVWWWVIPVCMLPIFFAMGWFAARVDMRAVLKQAKTVPTDFYAGVDALVDKNTDVAVRAFGDVLAKQEDTQEAYELAVSMGKLYRNRGENDKAIALHQKLLDSPDLLGEKRQRVLYELGQDFQNAGLVDRAEHIFQGLKEGNAGTLAREVLLNIYQQDRDWQKAIEVAQELSHDAQTYQFEIAQFYCELAQTALFRSQFAEAQSNIDHALNYNRKCTRANMLRGDVAMAEQRYQDAIDAYTAIEQQNHAYLSMVGEKLFDAYQALDQAEQGLNVLIGYIRTFPQLDLIDVIYEKALVLRGEEAAAALTADLVRIQPDLRGAYRLLGMQLSTLDPTWRADADMMRGIVGRYARKALMYRCRHCHFKSQVFFWHCPACNKWETFTPNKIEV
ncbi:MAG: lipopolysaccharide assembly protein LapB [Vitreoscilla sp.]|nr:lipopolysaccharide assembly protein LapB [Vitreoscilla sp.]MBP9539517.1 lipopolysaccharide assembly protein LapB [Vitreoscilla sp.]